MTQEDKRILDYIDSRIQKLAKQLASHGEMLATRNHVNMMIALAQKKEKILEVYGLDKKSLQDQTLTR